jgi:pSer/pThr/pTyr-binding forkhead associated (FHA) protein
VSTLELAPLHARFVREAQGDYVQNLSEQGGTFVNGIPVQKMHLLQPGDHLCFGTFHLTYLSALHASVGPVPSSQEGTPVNVPLSNGPMPLRLPSRPKES